MFDSIIAVLRGVFQGIWDAFMRAGTTVWGIVVAGVAIVTSLLQTVNDWIADVLTAIASIAIPGFSFDTGGPVASALGLANRMFPMTELCVHLAAWGTLCAALMVYHVVKSWLPGVAAS